MDKNTYNTIHYGHRVTSSYAEIYLTDSHCDYVPSPSSESSSLSQQELVARVSDASEKEKWVSPSDVLIGIIELKPPFTSKIVRGKTHEGILAIGDQVLQREKNKFLRCLKELLSDNELEWQYVMDYEKEMVTKKVRKFYEEIFEKKSKTMMEEISKFYENTLTELDKHLKEEIKDVLISSHSNMIGHLNVETKEKLKKERNILHKILRERYNGEIKKIKHYYKLLLDNEKQKNDEIVNASIVARNDALKVFCNQLDNESVTGTMYVLSTERKRCRMKKFILDNYQSAEIQENVHKIKEIQEVIDTYKARDVPISRINQEWQEKIKKIVDIFMKFISFTLKLLPEQSMFLLDFKNMLMLQLTEMKKSPVAIPNILQDEEVFQNVFQFESQSIVKQECPKPFEIEGDPSDPTPVRYGSRETLPSDVDLPTIRVQRQFVYAKCHGYEDIKAVLESQRCVCSDIPTRPPPQTSVETAKEEIPLTPPIQSESSNENLLASNFNLLNDCPARICTDWIAQHSFPVLENYLDFTENNYEKVKVILGKPKKKSVAPDIIYARDIAHRDLPYSATHEPYHHVGTQYSSQENLYVPALTCPCIEGDIVKQSESHYRLKESPSTVMNTIFARRRTSIARLMRDNLNLQKYITDESFDFQM